MKTRKPSTAQKPPVPSDSHAVIEDWMRRVMPDLHPIVKRLDELICETIPALQYAVKWKKAYYGLPDLGWIIEMVAYDVSVNVVFFGGAGFDPPPPLGTTERTRYVKLTTRQGRMRARAHSRSAGKNRALQPARRRPARDCVVLVLRGDGAVVGDLLGEERPEHGLAELLPGSS